MVFSTSLGRRLGVIATACLLSVALPASAAWAQKTKTKDAPAAETSTSATSSSVSVEIPQIDAVDSNIDETTLRAIFSGELVENAEALAGLTATSITIPEIILSASTTIDGEPHQTDVIFSNLVLSDVADGIAASATLSGMSLDAADDGSGEFGEISAANLDIGGVLGLYGLVGGAGQTELETIYTNFSFEGGSFESEEMSCTIGGMTTAEFKARPLNYSFSDMMALLETIEGDDDPSPETIGNLLRMYVDMFTAFETSPTEFAGFDCAGEDEGRPMAFSVAGMSMGAMSPGIYPSIAMDGFDITVEGDGTFQLGNLTFKELDLSGPIAAIEAGPEAMDEAWFTTNARSLIPEFAGFSFSDFAIDIPDPDADGERIAASVAEFDLTLGSYFNGIPTALLTTASNIIVDLPEDTDDEQLQQLLAMGVTRIDAGFTIDTSWNEAEDLINIAEFSMTGADLATATLSGTLTNATDALFSLDENVSLVAAMGVAIRHLKLDLTDAGLSDIILASLAAEQGADLATLRPVYAGLAEGGVIGIMAGAAEAQKVGAALSAFISGKASNLTIDMTAKSPQGLGMMDFMAAEDDPSVLIGKVVVNATAK